VGATGIAGDSGSLDLDAHSNWITPPEKKGKFFYGCGRTTEQSSSPAK
jgi:hypothetical protein